MFIVNCLKTMCKLTNLTLLLNNAYNLIFIKFLIILQIK